MTDINIIWTGLIIKGKKMNVQIDKVKGKFECDQMKIIKKMCWEVIITSFCKIDKK